MDWVERKMQRGSHTLWAIIFCLIAFISLWSCSTQKPTERTKVGSIFVNSIPAGGEILLDRVLTSKVTPDTIFDVVVGDHVVTVTKDGYLTSPDSLILTVQEDQTATAEFVLLETSYGSLEVSSNVDGATICLDNQPTTQITPHVFFNSVPVGTHIISVFKEGYANENPAKEVVNITTGDTIEVNFILSPAEVGKSPGNIVPDFELEDDYGTLQRFYAYRGFVTIVNFWAKSCYYCMLELPYLQEIYTEYLSDSLIIFGINYEDDFDFIRQTREENQIGFLLLKGVGSQIVNWVQLPPSPVTIILDRDGRIYYYHLGFQSYAPERFRQKLNELFGK